MLRVEAFHETNKHGVQSFKRDKDALVNCTLPSIRKGTSR